MLFTRRADNQFSRYDNMEVFNALIGAFNGVDSSWGNDAMPSIEAKTGDGRYLKIWIDYASHDMREQIGYSTIEVCEYSDSDYSEYIDSLWKGEPVGNYIESIRNALK